MAKCTDNERLGRIGCGQTYYGEMQHSVAKVPWSEFPDGMAHMTARAGLIDMLWQGNVLRDPKDFGLVKDDRGVWHKPMSESERTRLNALGRKSE